MNNEISMIANLFFRAHNDNFQFYTKIICFVKQDKFGNLFKSLLKEEGDNQLTVLDFKYIEQNKNNSVLLSGVWKFYVAFLKLFVQLPLRKINTYICHKPVTNGKYCEIK